MPNVITYRCLQSANKLVVFHSVVFVVESIPSSGYDGSQKEDRYCSLSCMDLLVLATAPFLSQWIWEVSPIRHRLATELIIIYRTKIVILNRNSELTGNETCPKFV